MCVVIPFPCQDWLQIKNDLFGNGNVMLVFQRNFPYFSVFTLRNAKGMGHGKFLTGAEPDRRTRKR